MSTWDDRPNDYEAALAEIGRLRAELDEERKLKEGWIAEFVKLRDMGEMPPDEYGAHQQTERQ